MFIDIFGENIYMVGDTDCPDFGFFENFDFGQISLDPPEEEKKTKLETRKQKIDRYLLKKKRRQYSYETRKKVAKKRPRHKGKFIKY